MCCITGHIGQRALTIEIVAIAALVPFPVGTPPNSLVLLSALAALVVVSFVVVPAATFLPQGDKGSNALFCVHVLF